MNLTRYRALADDLLQRASSDPGKQRDFLRRDFPLGEPKDAPYRPTGVTKIDQLLEALPIRWQYGGDDAANVVRFFTRDTEERATLRNFTNDEHYIRIPDREAFLHDDEYTPTVVHEAMHWAMTRDPDIKLEMGMPNNSFTAAKENLTGAMLSPGYIVEELAAEIGATILLDWAGASDAMADRADYVSNYMHAVPAQFKTIAYEMAKYRAMAAFQWMLAKAGMDEDSEPSYGSDA